VHQFEVFSRDRRNDLKRIAYATRGEMSADDLTSEAWLLGLEIEEKLGRPFDFTSPLDQDRLLAWMHNRFVKYADKSVRHAIKLDTGWDDDAEDSAGARISRMLLAPDGTDPLKHHVAQEEGMELLQAARRSYSQAAAYVILLVRSEWDMRALAADLWLGVTTLRRRMGAAAEIVKHQPALFDGVEEIPLDFVPARRRRALRRLFGAALQAQSEWWAHIRDKVSSRKG
jgi:hypothetical protein